MVVVDGGLFDRVNGAYVRVFDKSLNYTIKTLSAGKTHQDNVIVALINGIGIKFTIKDLSPGYYVSTLWGNQIVEMTYPKSKNPVQCLCEVASIALGIPVTNESTYQTTLCIDLEQYL